MTTDGMLYVSRESTTDGKLWPLEVIEHPAAVLRTPEGELAYTVHLVNPIKYELPRWSQRDERWADDRLGTCATTIGKMGCLLTDMAAAITKAIGRSVDPALLNKQLTDNNGYLNGCNLIFSRITKLYPSVQFVELKRCRTTPAPAKDIARWVNEGQIVVVQVDMDLRDADVDQHWLLVTGGTEDVLTVHDPWPTPYNQDEFKMPPAYCKVRWTPARAIYAYARYVVAEG